MEKFKTLNVYQRALKYSVSVRKVCKGFPKEELFGLSSQFRRAADSIVLNIAEGAGNSSKKEFARFLDFSIRSGFECLGCLDIAGTNGYIIQNDFNSLSNEVNEIIAMLHGLKKSLKNNNSTI
ncbi:MAG TPA: four helix bundle protein [Bacteroidota bacterium]|nr:four helix bundle protein [Bacteroidota bacterium]